jgi:hypothetical protein
MDKKIAFLNIANEEDHNLYDLDVPFMYGDGEKDVEGRGVVTIDPVDKTYEIIRVFPSEIDDQWPKEDIHDWMAENYPEYKEIN